MQTLVPISKGTMTANPASMTFPAKNDPKGAAKQAMIFFLEITPTEGGTVPNCNLCEADLKKRSRTEF